MRNLRDATLLGRGLDRVGLGLNRGPAICSQLENAKSMCFDVFDVFDVFLVFDCV